MEARALHRGAAKARFEEKKHRARLLPRHERDRARAAREGDRSSHQDQVSVGRHRRGRQARPQVVRDDARSRHARQRLAEERQGSLRRREQAHDEAGNLQHDRPSLPPLRAEGDRNLLRPHHGARLPQRVQGWHLVR